MSAMVAMDGTGAAFHPFLAGTGIAFEARFVAEEDFAGRIGDGINHPRKRCVIVRVHRSSCR